MYPYHNRIKQRIRNGELIDYWFTDDYPRIGKALVMRFSTEPYVRPVREYRFNEYVEVLDEWRKQRKGCA